MSARQRLVSSARNYLMILFIMLIITVGFPYLAEFMDVAKEEIPGLVMLDALGYYVLRASPILLILLFLISIWRLKSRQKKINQQIDQSGVTYLMLPRADGLPVKANQVTLWHRIALALPYYKHISFEMSGGEDGIVFSLRADSQEEAKNVLSKVMAEWPGTQMHLVKEQDPLPAKAYWIEVRPTNADQPIVASTPDPTLALLSEIAILPKGVQAGLQVLVREDPFTRLSHSRKADDKTRKKPDPKFNPLIVQDEKKNPYTYNLSAEERRQIRWLDERAQEAFVEASLIVWAACESSKLARQIANNLAKTLAAQYHPNNKLILGWRMKPGNLRARTFPTFSGRPWVASELGTIAHLVGKDALLAAPQLKVAPARPLPASTECRITEHVRDSYYLTQWPTLMIDSDLPALMSFDSDLPALAYDQEDLPTLVIEKS